MFLFFLTEPSQIFIGYIRIKKSQRLILLDERPIFVLLQCVCVGGDIFLALYQSVVLIRHSLDDVVKVFQAPPPPPPD